MKFHSEVDFNQKMFKCPCCGQLTRLPKAYEGITPQNKPAELHANYTTLTYTLPLPPGPPPVYLFCIDTCMEEEELNALKTTLLSALDFLPSNAIVGLITFGTTIQVYELSFTECTKVVVFSGETSPSIQKFMTMLNLKSKSGVPVTNVAGQQTFIADPASTARYLLPLANCEGSLTSVLYELQPDPWPVHPSCRSRRATGAALNIATSLLEVAYPGYGGHIITFFSGPGTIGPGQIAGLPLKETIRLHRDIREGKASYLKNSTEFYNRLTQRLVANGHCIDFFIGALDQVGLLEMKACVENTGGSCAFTDTFTNDEFQKSLEYFFKEKGKSKQNLAQNANPATTCHSYGLNGTIEVKTSRDVALCGAIGPVTSLNNKTATNVCERTIGWGGTNTWKINSLDPNTTIGFYFDVTNQVGVPAAPMRVFQFITQYQYESKTFLRVTTRALKTLSTENKIIAQTFDQEAATVLMARQAVFKADTTYLVDVLNWIDRSLIRFVATYGIYNPGDPNSLQLQPTMTLFPQFLYNFRKSRFLKVFNSSPDETSYARLYLNRETTTNCLIMIQPALREHSLTAPARPVMLDAKSVKKDNVLILDTFFQLVIHNGDTIAKWREAGYQNDPKYKTFSEILKKPKEEGLKMIENRFPYPLFIECDEGSSQARYLSSRVNPSTSKDLDPTAYRVLTDDVAYETFVSALRGLVVNFNQNEKK